MADENNELNSDKLLINKIIKNEIFNYTELFDYLENKSIYWNDDILAVQILTLKIVDEYQINKKIVLIILIFLKILKMKNLQKIY